MSNIKHKIAKLVRETATRISPRLNTELCYLIRYGEKIDLSSPQKLSEKNSWLKLYDYNHNAMVKQLSDKVLVRDYMKKNGYGDLLTTVYAIYESEKDIEWEKLPNKFVIKLNVGSKCNFICRDKSKIDIVEAKKTIKKWFDKSNLKGFYLAYAEMQYKDVKPLILVEEFIEDKDNSVLIDYKFFCYDGKCDYVMVCTDRFSKSGTKFYFYDKKWNLKNFSVEAENDPCIEKPIKIEEAFRYAELLSKGFPFVRIDLYIVGEKIYFGEYTFTGSGGMDVGVLPKADIMFGGKIKLPKEKKEV